MGSGVGAVAKPAAGGPGVEAGPVQQLFRRFTALILLYFSDFTPTCYCRRAVKSISALTGQELWS